MFCRCFVNTQWSLWGSLFFLFGAFFWLISPVICLIYDEDVRCEYYATVASLCFVVNGTLYLIESWSKKRIHGKYLRIYGGGVSIGSKMYTCSKRLDMIDWFFWTHLFFFAGAFGDLCTSILSSFIDIDPKYRLELWSDIFATHTWLISACFALGGRYRDILARDTHKAKIIFTFFPCQSSDGVLYCFNYHLLADWIFFVGSFQYAAGAWLEFVFPDAIWTWYIQISAGATFIFEPLSSFCAHIQEHNVYKTAFHKDDLESVALYDKFKQQDLFEDQIVTTPLLADDNEDYHD